MSQNQEIRCTLSVLVDNEPGVLARVIGLFSGRGYNIESLTVAEIDTKVSISRISIVTCGTPMVIEQIKAQLRRLVPVHDVDDRIGDSDDDDDDDEGDADDNADPNDDGYYHCRSAGGCTARRSSRRCPAK